MALPASYPFAIRGDSNAALSRWRYAGVSDLNTDRARVWVKLEDAGGGQVTVSLYRDEDQGAADLVAQGTGTAGDRITLLEQNASGLEVSVIVQADYQPADGIVLWFAIASQTDLRERDDRIMGLLLEDESDFSAILKATMRTFLTLMAERFPPAPSVGDPLAWGQPNRPATSARPEPEIYAEALWSTKTSVWELTGLQNPEDFKEWAILDSLAKIWLRKVRGADGPEIGVSDYYQRLANQQWGRVMPWVDLGPSGTPDRPARVRSVRIRRG